MTGITLDTGALIALERGKRRMLAVVAAAVAHDIPVYVPAPALAEYWRMPNKSMRELLARCCVLPLSRPEAEALGGVLARLGGRSGSLFVDASVALLAALHGPLLYTSDPDDLADICGRAGLSARILAI